MLKLTVGEVIRRLSPYRTVTGDEYKKLTVVFALMEPVYSFNDQRSWTDVYHLDGRVYQVTGSFSDADEIVEVLND